MKQIFSVHSMWLLCIVLLLFLGIRAVRQIGADAPVFYYGSKVLLSGGNPYNNAEMIDAWAQTSAPARFKPGPPTRFFLHTPIIAFLYSPAAGMNWHSGLLCVGILNFMALLLLLGCLWKLCSNLWSAKQRALLCLYLLTLPALWRTYTIGQCGIMICAMMALGIVALKYQRSLPAGVVFACALAKYTLSAPLLLVLLVHRKWRTLGWTLGVFIGVNILLLGRIGVLNGLRSMAALTAKSLAIGSVNDPLRPDYVMSADMIHITRLMAVIFGNHRHLVELLAQIAGLFLFAAVVLVLMRANAKAEPFSHPLELPVVVMLALVLVYHRFYDLVGLVFVGMGVWEYHLQHPERQKRAVKVTMGLLFALPYLTYGTRYTFPMQHILKGDNPIPPTQFSCLLNFLLCLSVMWMLYRDKTHYESAGRLIDEPTRTAAAASL